MVSIGYIAGFIDGEGSFSAHSNQKASPSVTIVNTDIDILNEISYTIERLISIRPHPMTRYRHKSTNLPGGDVSRYKTVYTLRLGAPILRKFLPIIIPELRVKSVQAKWMLELVNLIPSVKGPHNCGINTKTWAKRQELVDKIMLKNHRSKEE